MHKYAYMAWDRNFSYFCENGRKREFPVTHRIFNTDLLYFFYFVVEIFEKIVLKWWALIHFNDES